jgi:hypothetical protein
LCFLQLSNFVKIGRFGGISEISLNSSEIVYALYI